MTKTRKSGQIGYSYPASREYLLLILQEAQNRNSRQFLDQADLEEVARYLKISTSEVTGVAEYYSLFSTRPRGRFIIRLCTSPVCRMLGSFDLLASLSELLGIETGETTADGLITLEQSECLGNCHRGPTMMINGVLYGGIDQSRLEAIVAELKAGRLPRGDQDPPETRKRLRGNGNETGIGSRKPAAPEEMISLGRAGSIDPESLEDYRAAGGFQALKKALSRPPEEVFREVTRSGLQGRGGAGFPTGKKEQAAEEALCASCGPKYVVCNADEGEPGTFKDRIIMEQNPFQLIEGIIISAWAIGAGRGYIYIRGEYTLSIERLTRAIESCRKAGLLAASADSAGTQVSAQEPVSAQAPDSFTFHLELRLGAGSYLCGEELTLLESLEGKRGYPRIKPPFPVEQGLFGAPTLINNVETFAHVPFVIEQGAELYRSLGSPSSPGSKIFCVSGDVNQPGYYEAPMGITLRDLIETECGGVKAATGMAAEDRAGREQAAGTAAAVEPFQAALLGGAAGTLVDASILDVPMTYQDLKEAGASLGSGAIIILDKSRSLYNLILSILEFFRHESCGKCIPCRVGTSRLVKLWEDANTLPAGGRGEALEKLAGEAEYMAASSLCPLGKSPIISLKSALRFFRDAI